MYPFSCLLLVGLCESLRHGFYLNLNFICTKLYIVFTFFIIMFSLFYISFLFQKSHFSHLSRISSIQVVFVLLFLLFLLIATCLDNPYYPILWICLYHFSCFTIISSKSGLATSIIKLLYF